ncbi:c-type cytochrome [Pseudomonas fontis]|uniref:C-type cytochrome n=1 Tax=Pseudomonas fontis TaxID=2942633 RepID=A0ABT5NMV1_9PSED|nr:c-type cytochrome [Pseudomonas fontis]MDD0975826.1 c-type cytochrome [Pseudomonas fontis]MDD0989500.1 c-type cytochrome [Pseudomonas fontis]
MEDQSQLKVPPASKTPFFVPPSEKELPDNAYGKMIRDGYALFVDTKRLAPKYVGNGLNCSNCHIDQGRLAHSAPLWGAYPMYPAYRKKNDKVNTFAERLQGCFQFSMNGTPPAADSPEITALSVYAYWLASKAPIGVEPAGRGYPDVNPPAGGYDLKRGAEVFQAQCALCHGGNGEGQKVGADYVMPPLWGKDSYNWGAGMHRINTAASFIKYNMPLGKPGSLSDQQAWDVAAFVNSHERPQDPRLVDGSVEKTRVKFHANDGVNLYGQTVGGVLIGQGTGK